MDEYCKDLDNNYNPNFFFIRLLTLSITSLKLSVSSVYSLPNEFLSFYFFLFFTRNPVTLLVTKSLKGGASRAIGTDLDVIAS